MYEQISIYNSKNKRNKDNRKRDNERTAHIHGSEICGIIAILEIKTKKPLNKIVKDALYEYFERHCKFE